MSRVAARSGIWAELDREIDARPAPQPTGTDLWARLERLVDTAEYRPRLETDIEVQEFHLRWGNDYAMIANPRDLIHYTLTPEELGLVRLMDGTRTLKEIILERLRESGDLELSSAIELVHSLYVGNFLDRRYFDVDASVRHAIEPVSSAREKARIFAKSLTVEWKGADRLVKWFYRNGFKVFFTRPAIALSLLLSVGGFTAFLYDVGSHRFFLTGKSVAVGVLILMGLNYFLTFCHELGHALVLTHFGRRVKSAGFQIYFGSPAFFVDASEALMLERRQRILQAAGGPLAESIVAGAASIAILIWPGWGFSETLYKFAVLNYLVLFENLIPLLELDGYFMLSDAIQVPDLRPRSLSFLRHDLWHKLRVRERFSRRELGLTGYGILGILFTIFSFYTAWFFWKQIFGTLISKLWHGGTVTQVLLVVLGVIVAGPIVRGLFKLLGSVALRIRALWRRIRFRMEMKWRVEAAELIDALPSFRDIPVDVLNDLSGRVRIRTLSRGQPVFRQGDRADAFYVVRRGEVQVVEEDPQAGTERVLVTLGRGQSFGELALVEETVRTATVRAVGEAELFEVDKATFDRLLADMIEMPDFLPTLQQLAELQALPTFGSLPPDQLSELLEHGRWVNIPPGEAIVEEGQVGDAFYAIGSGQVNVERGGEVVDVMGPGQYFGEVALLMDVPRTATVRARTPLRAFRVERDGFDRLVADSFRRGRLKPNIVLDRTQEH